MVANVDCSHSKTSNASLWGCTAMFALISPACWAMVDVLTGFPFSLWSMRGPGAIMLPALAMSELLG
jgi:dolichol kinase